MQESYEEFRRLDSEVFAVSFAPPEKIGPYQKMNPLPFPVLSDPERTAYKAFALDRTSWKQIFHPRVVGRYLKLMFKGWMPWRANKEEDLLQLGGDFVLDEERQLVYAYRSADPTDRPSAQALLDAVRKSAGAD